MKTIRTYVKTYLDAPSDEFAKIKTTLKREMRALFLFKKMVHVNTIDENVFLVPFDLS